MCETVKNKIVLGLYYISLFFPQIRIAYLRETPQQTYYLFLADKIRLSNMTMSIIPLSCSMVNMTHHAAVFITMIIGFSWCPVGESYWTIVVNPNKSTFTIQVITTNPNVHFSMQYKMIFIYNAQIVKYNIRLT